mgnify:CR=1 FL=1
MSASDSTSSLNDMQPDESSSSCTIPSCEIGETVPISSEPAPTIAQSLSRVRTATVTLLNETSKAAKKQRVPSSSSSNDDDSAIDFQILNERFGDDYLDEEEEEEEEPELVQVVAAVEAIRATDDVLPSTKIKASKESLPIMEVQKLVTNGDNSGSAACQKVLCENIFTLISCLVAERIVTSGHTFHETDKIHLFGTYYYEQCANAGLNSYLHDNVFKYLTQYFSRDEEGKLEWPPFYTSYVRDNYESKKLTGYQRNRAAAVKKMSEAEGQKYNFALSVHKAAGEAKTEINNRLNRLWRDPLDSGETPSGLFDVIRETSRERDAFLRAKAAVHHRLAEKYRQGPEYEEAVKKKTDKFLDDMKTNYFPSYWLTFAVFARPAPTNHQLVIFKTTNIKDLQSRVVHDVASGKQHGKTSRQVARAALRGDGTPTSLPFPRRENESPSPSSTPTTRRGGTSSSKNVNVSHTINPPMEDNSEEGLLMRQLTILQTAGKKPDGTYFFQDQINECTQSVAEIINKKLEAMREKQLMETPL